MRATIHRIDIGDLGPGKEKQVIVITAYPSMASPKEAVRLGAYNYLTKPLGPDEVIKAANEHGLAMAFTGVRHFRH